MGTQDVLFYANLPIKVPHCIISDAGTIKAPSRILQLDDLCEYETAIPMIGMTFWDTEGADLLTKQRTS